ISLISDPSATTTVKAAQRARYNGALVSYDPNVRLALWPSETACREAILNTLALSDIVKLSLEELRFLTGSEQPAAAEKLRAQHNIAMLILTLDSHGCQSFRPGSSLTVKGFEVEIADATGAGDAFMSGLLSGILPHIKPSANRATALNAISNDQ